MECLKEKLNDASAANANAMIRIVDELESIADSCYNLILLAQRRYDKKIRFAENSLGDINRYTASVVEFLGYNRRFLDRREERIDLDRAYELEDRINAFRKSMKKAARKRLSRGGDVRAELLFIDVLSQIERIGDYSLNVSQAIRQIR